jgi:hypothetical protein
LFVSIPVGDLELSRPGEVPLPNHLGQALLLVRLHGVPLGTLSMLAVPPDREVDLHALALERFRPAVAAHLAADGGGSEDLLTLLARRTTCAAAPTPSHRLVSVVICTLGEDPRLQQTVASVLAQTHDRLELIVVDNQPDSSRVPALLAGFDDARGRRERRCAGLHR